jgi:hypothetical protein
MDPKLHEKLFETSDVPTPMSVVSDGSHEAAADCPLTEQAFLMDEDEEAGELLGGEEMEVANPLQAATDFVYEILMLVEEDFGAWNSQEFKDVVCASLPQLPGCH